MGGIMRQSTDATINIGLVDNDPYALNMIRAHIRYLDPAFNVVWTATTGAMAVHRCLFDAAPQVLVLDMALADMDGVKVCETIRRRTDAIGIVGITALNPRDYSEPLAKVGGQAIVPKEAIGMRLRPAIIAAAAGRPCTSDQGQSAPFMTTVESHRLLTAQPTPAALSATEQAVARLYLQQCPTKDIARRLNISTATVYVHVHQIMRKTGTTSRQEALRACQSHHLC